MKIPMRIQNLNVKNKDLMHKKHQLEKELKKLNLEILRNSTEIATFIYENIIRKKLNKNK
tara:strand:- start:724 stop:903 length:180 start_codon:yes stop_codon:yes gene_type:complete